MAPQCRLEDSLLLLLLHSEDTPLHYISLALVSPLPTPTSQKCKGLIDLKLPCFLLCKIQKVSHSKGPGYWLEIRGRMNIAESKPKL